jgi:hypothetical protein
MRNLSSKCFLLQTTSLCHWKWNNRYSISRVSLNKVITLSFLKGFLPLNRYTCLISNTKYRWCVVIYEHTYTAFIYYHFKMMSIYSWTYGIIIVCLHNIWVDINDGISFLSGIGMEGEILVIHNVSRYCDGIYQCVASNDVPPAVEMETAVFVECTYCTLCVKTSRYSEYSMCENVTVFCIFYVWKRHGILSTRDIIHTFEPFSVSKKCNCCCHIFKEGPYSRFLCEIVVFFLLKLLQ